MEWIVALLMVVGILSIIIMLYMFAEDRYISALIFFIVSTITIISLGLIALNLDLNKEIPAIEAYRGNTALQITYIDNIPIDSVVVYKINKLITNE